MTAFFGRWTNREFLKCLLDGKRTLRIRAEGSTKFADVNYVAPPNMRFRSMVEQRRLSWKNLAFYPVPQQIGLVKFLIPTAAISSFLYTMVGPQLPNSKALWFNLTDIGARKYKSKKEAAMAYDSAAIKLRNGLSHRNFPLTDIIVGEPNFQNQFSIETVLIMIKDGSYASKFSDYLRAQDRQGYSLEAFHDTSGVKLRQLFQKELTPSDVSKLDRL